MRFAGAVTAFTAGLAGRLFARGDALEVRILIEFRRDVGVAGFTNLAAYEGARRAALDQSGRWLREGGDSGGQQGHDERTNSGHDPLDANLGVSVHRRCEIKVKFL